MKDDEFELTHRTAPLADRPRRNPKLLSAIVALSIAVVGGGAWAFWWMTPVRICVPVRGEEATGVEPMPKQIPLESVPLPKDRGAIDAYLAKLEADNAAFDAWWHKYVEKQGIIPDYDAQGRPTGRYYHVVEQVRWVKRASLRHHGQPYRLCR